MQTITYQQDPELSAETLSLEDSRLIILSERYGDSSKKIFYLSELEPYIEMQKRRFKVLYMVPLCMGVLITIVILAIGLKYQWPHVILAVGVGAGVYAYGHAIKGLQKIEVSQFVNKSGNVQFEIYKPRSRTVEYDEFISVLLARIKKQVEVK